MKILLKNCKIIQESSSHHNKKMDILINKGKIEKIERNISDSKAKIVESKNLHCSAGWIDIGTHLGEPGFEQRETFESLSNAAIKGGYTDIVTMPDSAPSIQTKAQIKSLIENGKANNINIFPLAALSWDMKGEDISEFHDLSKGGAIGFTDGLHPIKKGGLLLRALQYIKGTDAIIVHHPYDPSLSNDNLIHEGEVSITLGLKGSPDIAEEIMIFRDLKLLEYSNSKLCIHLLNSKKGLKLIKDGKKSNDALYSGVSYLNIVATHEDLSQFDANFKVIPILRNKKDKKALINGLLEDTIDYIASNHKPLEVEKKELEFMYADHGAIGLETCFAAVNTMTEGKIPLSTLIKKLTSDPRKVYNLDEEVIEENNQAKLTIFDPTISWKYTASDIASLSRNTPFKDQTFTGKALGVITNGQLILN